MGPPTIAKGGRPCRAATPPRQTPKLQNFAAPSGAPTRSAFGMPLGASMKGRRVYNRASPRPRPHVRARPRASTRRNPDWSQTPSCSDLKRTLVGGLAS